MANMGLTIIPIWISLGFGTIIALIIRFLYKALKHGSNGLHQYTRISMILILIRLSIQAILSILGVYYKNPLLVPPTIVIWGILPTIILLIICFCTKVGRWIMDSLSIKYMTYLNVVRIPIEIILYLLFIDKLIPEIMTFTGRNYDIISGLTAPVIGYLYFNKNIISKRIIIVWNVVCLLLLINIVVLALLSGPTPLQQFGFSQPNIAILYFPISRLPTFVVPVVLFGHIISIRQLIFESNA